MDDHQVRADYLPEIRAEVCAHCVDRPDGGPPCAPLGKQCGIEMHLSKLVAEVHIVRSAKIDPYLDNLHQRTCTVCDRRDTEDCPCPLDYLHILAVQAIDQVDCRRRQPHPLAT